jgi:hypothetical protein
MLFLAGLKLNARSISSRSSKRSDETIRVEQFGEPEAMKLVKVPQP